MPLVCFTIYVWDWEPTYSPDLQDWTLEQYAASDHAENNWMAHQLSNQMDGELTEDNLRSEDCHIAMEVLQTKFIVGLMNEMERSVTRFEKIFRWTYRVIPTLQEACRERLVSGGGSNSNKQKYKRMPLTEKDSAWSLLAHQNSFDLELYAHIQAGTGTACGYQF